MKTFILFLVLLGQFVHADDYEPGSNERLNLLEIRDVLYFIPDDEMPEAGRLAIQIMTKFETGNLAIHDPADVVGWENAEGRTFRNGYTSLRSDFALPRYHFTWMGDNIEDFKKGTHLLRVLSHEIQHTYDYTASGGVTTDENSAYRRGYQFMMDFMRVYLIPNWQTAGGDEASTWRERIHAYSVIMYKEIDSYDVSDYGEIEERFRPPFDHSECVRNLTRSELKDYLTHLAAATRNERPYQEAWEDFNQRANFYFPGHVGTDCALQAPTTTTLSEGRPVGYQGPRDPHTLFRFSVQQGHLINIRKTAGGSNIDMGIAVARGGSAGLEEKGRLYHYYQNVEFRPDQGGTHYLVIIPRNGYQGEVGFNITGSYRDEDGNLHQYNVPAEEVSIQDNAPLGYYPIFETSVTLTFNQQSVTGPSGFRLYEFVRFDAREGDYLRFEVSEINQRGATLYRLNGETNADRLPQMEYIAQLHTWVDSGALELPDDGTYLLRVSRPGDIANVQQMQVNLQLSRNGSVSPTEFAPEVLTEEQSAAYGYYPPHTFRTSITLNSTSPDGQLGAFKWHQVLALDARAGDHFQVHSTASNRIIQFVAVNNLGQMNVLNTLYSHMSGGTFHASDDRRYYLILGNSLEFHGERGVGLTITRWRHGATSPTDANPHWLNPEELARLGFFPAHEQRVDLEFNNEMPTGLVRENRRYQLYTFSVENTAHFHVTSPNPGVERRFILFRIDDDAYHSGQPSMVEFYRHFPWYDSFRRYLDQSGRYVLMVEADRAGATGTLHFRLNASQDDSSSKSLRLMPLNLNQMLDPRYRIQDQ